MTVNNIINMAKLNNLDIIALTDHNTCKNCPAAAKLAEKANICFISGMEICTCEEVHVVCLFSSVENAMAFDEYVYSHIPDIKNREDIFGNQYILNEKDNIIGKEEKLIINASTISILDIKNLMEDFGGFAFPAHIDRNSYSVLSNLGYIPAEAQFSTVEINDKESFYSDKSHLRYQNQYNNIFNSDAHYLWNISMGENKICLENKTYEALKKRLEY